MCNLKKPSIRQVWTKFGTSERIYHVIFQAIAVLSCIYQVLFEHEQIAEVSTHTLPTGYGVLISSTFAYFHKIESTNLSGFCNNAQLFKSRWISLPLNYICASKYKRFKIPIIVPLNAFRIILPIAGFSIAGGVVTLPFASWGSSRWLSYHVLRTGIFRSQQSLFWEICSCLGLTSKKCKREKLYCY